MIEEILSRWLDVKGVFGLSSHRQATHRETPPPPQGEQSKFDTVRRGELINSTVPNFKASE